MEDMRKVPERPSYDKDNIKKQPFEYYMREYQKADPEEIKTRLNIMYDTEKRLFHLCFVGKRYQISWPEFINHPEEDTGGYDPLATDNSARILMLRYLLQSNIAVPSGKFLSFREMPSGDLYFKQFQGRCLLRLTGKYGKRLDVFRRIMKKLGAKETDYADFCGDIELFDGLWIRFILWEGDEEFSPSSQILFSDNFTAAFDTYDLAEIGGICINMFGAVEKLL